MKEEARRKKLGITRKVYDPEAQPWLMRVGGKGGRKYKVNIHLWRAEFLRLRFSILDLQGIREGGVSNNTTFYVFTHGKDGAFEAFPIKDWLVSWMIFLLCSDLSSSLCRYNFTPIQRYKTLDAEEAEERFANRGKVWM